MNNQQARDEVMARVRDRLGHDPLDAEARRSAALEYMAAHSRGPRPAPKRDLQQRFRMRSEALASTVDEVATQADIPAAVARYLRGVGLPQTAVCWPQYAALDWTGNGLRVEARAANANDLVGITGVFCAIAETATLMLLSGPETAATTSLLPETHIAIVPASRIVAGMEDGFALLRKKRGELPRAVNFISGPSRTGDIEQTIVLGAHGPYRVHLILISGE